MKLAIALIIFAAVVCFIFDSSIYSHQCSRQRKGRPAARRTA